ncbi:MAG: type II secretion system protein [Clostridium sp.]|uniref:type II secretion system protein n=1 Tax=Clostridium sp. TaxID=1506 RepID=UPI002FC6BB4B
MCMLKRDKKKGVTLIELIIALSVFILLAIPVTNGILASIKTNKAATENRDMSLAMSYAYENLKKAANDGRLVLDGGVTNSSIKYTGKLDTYSFSYNAETIAKLESKESIDKPNNIEFKSNMIKLTITLRSGNGSSKSETYNFKVD